MVCDFEFNTESIFCVFVYLILGDGTVNFAEFVNILEKMSEESYETSAEEEERELRDAFRIFDKHNRGYITASDLRAVLRCLGKNLDEDESNDNFSCSTNFELVNFNDYHSNNFS